MSDDNHKMGDGAKNLQKNVAAFIYGKKHHKGCHCKGCSVKKKM